MGEHTPVDALVPSVASEYAVIEPINPADFASPEPAPLVDASASTTSLLDGWQRLDWDVDDHIRNECVVAEERARKVIDDSDDRVLWFTDYGADWIKKTRTASLLPSLPHAY
jgi:carnitine O-acetyltransferase